MSDKIYVSWVTFAVYANAPEDALGYAKTIRSEVLHEYKNVKGIIVKLNKPNIAQVPRPEKC